MKKGIINYNQCCMGHVWLNGSNYVTSSTEYGYQLFYMSSPGQGAVNIYSKKFSM